MIGLIKWESDMNFRCCLVETGEKGEEVDCKLNVRTIKNDRRRGDKSRI